MTKSYNVGWYYYTPEQLEALFPGDLAAYRERAQAIVPFGHTEACWTDTPQKAQDFLNQIVSVNSESNLKQLTQLGASGLFIVERQVIDGMQVKLSRYTLNHDEIANLAPYQMEIHFHEFDARAIELGAVRKCVYMTHHWSIPYEREHSVHYFDSKGDELCYFIRNLSTRLYVFDTPRKWDSCFKESNDYIWYDLAPAAAGDN